MDTLIQWVNKTDELSNAALEKAIDAADSPILKKALSWSEAVNESIRQIPKEEIKPFTHVKESIEKLHETCDIAIVSSANCEAVKEEWTRFGLLEHVDVLLAQNAGSKKSCISKLLTYGYEREHVMMTGDAPGDMDAAKDNNVFFYPILVSKESMSWSGILDAAERMKEGTFGGAFQEALIKSFIKNLTE